MKTLSALLLLLTGLTLHAQESVPPPPETTDVPPPAAGADARALRTPAELDELLGPIALYPDALIALILPATAAPADIVLAARHLRDHPKDRSQVEHRAWDESVKSLTNYPEVLTWLDENLHWTKQVGEAFSQQPADVMQAVQRLRAKARAAGTLVDTPQQQVLAEPDSIRIVPAQPDVIYVPHYQPEIVFVDRPIYYGSPFLTFGTGVAVGSWLAYDCDWRRRVIWCGDRRRPWSGHNWRQPLVVPPSHGRVTHTAPVYGRVTYTAPGHVRQWHPRPVTHRPGFHASNFAHVRPEVVRPSPFGTRTHTAYVPPARSSTYSPGFEARRRIAPAPLPRAEPLPLASPPPAGELPGPRAPVSSRRSPSSYGLAANPAPAPTPALVTPLPSPTPAAEAPGPRNWGGSSRSREAGSPGRSYRATPPPSAPLPTASPLPLAGSSAPPVVTGPVAPARSYSRAHSSPPPAAPLPMARQATPVPVANAPAAAPAPAPAPQRSADAPRPGRRNPNEHEH